MAAKFDDPFSELPDTTPVYRLLKDHYMEDDTMHPEDEVIAFTGTPTEWMEPLNDPARNVMRTYIQFLDKCAEDAAIKAGRPFSGRITDLGDQIAQAMNDARTADVEIAVFHPRFLADRHSVDIYFERRRFRFVEHFDA